MRFESSPNEFNQNSIKLIKLKLVHLSRFVSNIYYLLQEIIYSLNQFHYQIDIFISRKLCRVTVALRALSDNEGYSTDN